MRATTRAEMQPRHTVAGSAPQACHDAWFDGKQAMATAGDRWKPNCPVCRLEFWPGESIEVLPRKLPKLVRSSPKMAALDPLLVDVAITP